MRALKGGTPRLYRDHRTRAAREYAGHVQELLDRLGGPCPKGSRPLVKQYAVICAELDDYSRQAQLARQRKQTKLINRLSRKLALLRRHLLALERELEARAKQAVTALTADQWLALTQADAPDEVVTEQVTDTCPQEGRRSGPRRWA